MKERPIIFSGGMIKAILEGKKTQTRRVMKPQPYQDAAGTWHWYACEGVLFGWQEDASHPEMPSFCPFGAPGDGLWVRETWAVNRRLDSLPPRELSFLQSNHDFPESTMYYRADSSNGINPLRGKWRPSIFMPRWASRIMLQVTGLRVERVQDISQDDMIAEGIYSDNDGITWIGSPDLPMCEAPSEAFIRLWDSINAKRGFGWNVNPWVWITEFKGVE